MAVRHHHPINLLRFFGLHDIIYPLITLLNTPSLAAGTKAVVYYRCYGIRTYKP